jgi:hypothetical protein
MLGVTQQARALRQGPHQWPWARSYDVKATAICSP